MQMPLPAGAVTTLVAPWGKPELVALTATTLYSSNGGISQTSLDGGASLRLPATAGAFSFAVDPANLYWVTQTGVLYKAPLDSASLDGGGASILVAGEAQGYIAASGPGVYWTQSTAGIVTTMPIAGGAVQTLATGQANPWGIATDGASVYWTNQDSGTVVKVPTGGGAVVTLASVPWEPGFIAVDATSVYFMSGAALYQVTPK
jgi:hypothetical protein